MMSEVCTCDCVEGMKKLSYDCIDLIVTDPPYYLMRKEFLDETITSFEEYKDWYEEWLKEAYRVLKDTGSLYVFVPVHHFAEIHILIKKYFVGKQVISWYKPNVMIQQFTMKNYFPKLEFIGFYTKEEKNYTWNKLFRKYGVDGACNFIVHKAIYKNTREGEEHSTQKPRNIIKKFIEASSNEGDVVLDPFCGSGTTLVEAKNLHRKFIGFDINPDFVKLSNERLRKVGEVSDWL